MVCVIIGNIGAIGSSGSAQVFGFRGFRHLSVGICTHVYVHEGGA